MIDIACDVCHNIRMVDHGLKQEWARAVEAHMRENPRDFATPTSADAVTTFIERKIDPELSKFSVTISKSSLSTNPNHKKILSLLLNSIMEKERKDSTTTERRNSALQTARAMKATLESGILSP
ncbi:MAG: hypothetical protein AAGB32_02735 [Pseudomonadota bacterium]